MRTSNIRVFFILFGWFCVLLVWKQVFTIPVAHATSPSADILELKQIFARSMQNLCEETHSQLHFSTYLEWEAQFLEDRLRVLCAHGDWLCRTFTEEERVFYRQKVYSDKYPFTPYTHHLKS